MSSDEEGQRRKEAKMGKFVAGKPMGGILNELDQALVKKQMQLTQRLRRSFDQVEKDMKDIFRLLDKAILGEIGLKKIDEFLGEFFAKFQEEAMNEADKYEKVGFCVKMMIVFFIFFLINCKFYFFFLKSYSKKSII